jgi:carboxyl-terminal processing protease
VQVLLPLPGELGAMKVTTGMFFLPAGMSTQQKGVPSDILVPSMLDGIDVGEKSLAYALPPQSTDPFISKAANVGEGPKRWRPIETSDIGALASKSKERIAKDADMQQVLKDLEEGKKNKGVVRLGDLRKKAQEEKQEEAKAAKDPKKNAKDAKAAKDAKDAKAKEEEKTARQQTREKFHEAQAVFLGEGSAILADLIGISGAPGQRYVGPAKTDKSE